MTDGPGRCNVIYGTTRPVYGTTETRSLKVSLKAQRDAIAKRKLAAEVVAMQANPPMVDQQHSYLLSTKGVDRKISYYMRHWIRAVKAAASNESI